MPERVYASHMMARRSLFNNADFCHEGRQERWVLLSNYVRTYCAKTPIRVKKFFNTSSTLSARKSEPSCSRYALSFLFLSSYVFITQDLPQIRLQWESIRVLSCSKGSKCSRRAYAGRRHQSHLAGSFRRAAAVCSAQSRLRWARSSDGDLPFYLVICLSYLNGLS